MEPTLFHLVGSLYPWSYLLVFVLMIVEGEAPLFVIAFFVEQNVLAFLPTLFFVISGVIIGDLLWYQLGAHLHRKNSKFAKLIKHITAPFERHLTARPGLTIFISKFFYGVNHALIARTGMIGMEPKFLMKYDVPAAIAWVFVIGGLGYLSGASFAVAARRLRIVEIMLVGSVVILYLLEYIFRRLYVHSESKV